MILHEHNCIINQQQLNCLFNSFFKLTTRTSNSPNLAFVRGIQWWPVDSPVMKQVFPGRDVLMLHIQWDVLHPVIRNFPHHPHSLTPYLKLLHFLWPGGSVPITDIITIMMSCWYYIQRSRSSNVTLLKASELKWFVYMPILQHQRNSSKILAKMQFNTLDYHIWNISQNYLYLAQWYFTGTLAIKWLLQCQCSNSKEYW